MGRRQTLYVFISQSKSLIVGVMGSMKDLNRKIWYDLLKKKKSTLLCREWNGRGPECRVRDDGGSDYGSNREIERSSLLGCVWG